MKVEDQILCAQLWNIPCGQGEAVTRAIERIREMSHQLLDAAEERDRFKAENDILRGQLDAAEQHIRIMQTQRAALKEQP